MLITPKSLKTDHSPEHHTQVFYSQMSSRKNPMSIFKLNMAKADMVSPDTPNLLCPFLSKGIVISGI